MNKNIFGWGYFGMITLDNILVFELWSDKLWLFYCLLWYTQSILK